MANVNWVYGTATALTITLNSLASSQTAMRSSAYVDNSLALAGDLEVDVTLTLALAAGTPGNDTAVYVYAFGSIDATNFTGGVGGTDAAYTATNPPNLPLIGVINFPGASTTLTPYGPFSLSAAFGGSVPPQWGIVVENYTGLALAASGCTATYRVAYSTVI